MSTESFASRPASFPARVLRTEPRQRQLEQSLAQGLSRRAPHRPWVAIEAEARRLARLLEQHPRNEPPP